MKGRMFSLPIPQTKPPPLDARNHHKMHLAAGEQLMSREVLLKSHSNMLNREGTGH